MGTFTLKHKNLILLALGIVFGFFLYNYKPFYDFLLNLGEFGYLGAVVAGILYDSTTSVSTSLAILFVVSTYLPPLYVIIAATFGAIIGDYLIFRFVRANLGEFRPLFLTLEHDLGRRRLAHIKHILHSRFFHWTLPVIAGILIGSPFPNEIAVGIMGATKVKTYQLLLMSMVFNFIGISLFVAAGRALVP